jgi:ribosomal protein S18 acetylase RimI-like enzyme
MHARTALEAAALPPPRTPLVTVLRWEDEDRVAALLARAFLDDPLVIAICGAPAAQRAVRMQWSFRIALRSHCLSRQPAWIGVDADAVPRSVVLATRARTSGHAYSDTLFTLRGLRHVGVRTALRGAQAARVIANHAPPQPFTYLRTLGVDPEHQRRGMGSCLVRQVIHTAPPELPMYLETAKEENLAFYARHGFEPAGEFLCLGVPVWRLIRPPTADPQHVGVAALAHFR